MLRQKGTNWVTETFEAGGSARNQLKDLNFVLAAAEESGIALPVASTVHSLSAEMIAEGKGGLDHTGIYLTLDR
ncbi:NAD-binding protein [Microbacteriaceae bacterium 4G12]